ncbi:MAG: efflux RND transporter periplasmic adaptor subunit, partial [Candidatus Cloacimonadota bacterium]|nr:efflux RND transporter periplasmic adaptor subunit [Candidatus Cloacimonadota bacterium]
MKKKISIIVVCIIALTIAVLLLVNKKKSNLVSYKFAKIEKDNQETIISCTGSLKPVSTVDVGTQISGKVEKVLVDYNDFVKENDVLAILDTLELSINYRSALADFHISKKQYELATREYENQQKLYEKNYISELDLLQQQYEFVSAQNNMKKAQANLEKADIYLHNYAIIRSPITGQIIDRNIDEGQTVAASLSAPTLFTVAADMNHMEIEAVVDETDIGQIKAEQKVSYYVDSYPDEEFTGLVKEIRLIPEIISNVVNYTVIISTKNRNNMLMPGMTAVLDILISSGRERLLVNSKALEWKPNQELLKKSMMVKNFYQSGKEFPKVNEDELNSHGILWTLNSEDKLQIIPVTIGKRLNGKTEIISSEELSGLQVIIGYTNELGQNTVDE